MIMNNINLIRFKKIFLKCFLFFAIPFVFIFLSLFLYFKITAPEATSILQNYILGDGEKLELHSTYLPTSPVIVKKLNKMKELVSYKPKKPQNESLRGLIIKVIKEQYKN